MLGSGRIGIDSGASASSVICELSNQFVRLGQEVTVADVRSGAQRTGLDKRVVLRQVDTPSPIYSTRPIGKGIYARIARKLLIRIWPVFHCIINLSKLFPAKSLFRISTSSTSITARKPSFFWKSSINLISTPIIGVINPMTKAWMQESKEES